MGKFNLSYWIRTLLQRVGALEAALGSNSPDDWENTVTDIRALTGYANEDIVGCYANESIYKFDTASTATDNGTTVLCPSNITPPATGRWLVNKRFSLTTHTHANLQPVPSSFNSGRFASYNTIGILEDSGTGANDFVAADPNKQLSEENFTSTHKQKLEGLPEAADFSSRMSKIAEPTTDQVGKFIKVSASGDSEVSTESEITVHQDKLGAITEKTADFTIDATVHAAYSYTINPTGSAIALEFVNVPANKAVTVMVELVNGKGADVSITWTGINASDWGDNLSLPTLPNGKTYTVSCTFFGTARRMINFIKKGA